MSIPELPESVQFHIVWDCDPSRKPQIKKVMESTSLLTILRKHQSAMDGPMYLRFNQELERIKSEQKRMFPTITERETFMGRLVNLCGEQLFKEYILEIVQKSDTERRKRAAESKREDAAKRQRTDELTKTRLKKRLKPIAAIGGVAWSSLRKHVHQNAYLGSVSKAFSAFRQMRQTFPQEEISEKGRNFCCIVQMTESASLPGEMIACGAQLKSIRVKGRYLADNLRVHLNNQHGAQTLGDGGLKLCNGDTYQPRKKKSTNNGTQNQSKRIQSTQLQLEAFLYDKSVKSFSGLESSVYKRLIEFGHPLVVGKRLMKNLIKIEFNAFKIGIRMELQELVDDIKNPFMQLLHDVVTLKDGKKRVAIGIVYAANDTDGLISNKVVCLSFRDVPDGSGDSLAEHIRDVLDDVTGLKQEWVAHVMSDVAAAHVSDKLDKEKEYCMMHQIHKLALAASGKLPFKVNGRSFGALKGFTDVETKFREIAKDITESSKNRAAFQDIQDELCLKRCLPSLNRSGNVKMNAEHNFFLSMLRSKPAIDDYVERMRTSEDRKTKQRGFIHNLTTVDWKILREVEAIQFKINNYNVFSQVESKMSAGVQLFLKSELQRQFGEDSVFCLVDFERLTASKGARTISRSHVHCREFTKIGTESRQRCMLEVNRRFKTESEREEIAHALDIRSIMLEKELLKQMKTDDNVSNNTRSNLKTTYMNRRQRTRKVAAQAYYNFRVNFRDLMINHNVNCSSTPGYESSDDEANPSALMQKNQVDNIFYATLDKIHNLSVEKLHFGLDDKHDWASGDAGHWLRFVLSEFRADKDVGNVVQFMRVYLGTLPSESFCERVGSVGKLIVGDHRTLLDSEWIDILSVLRINKEYVKFLKRKWGKKISKKLKSDDRLDPESRSLLAGKNANVSDTVNQILML